MCRFLAAALAVFFSFFTVLPAHSQSVVCWPTSPDEAWSNQTCTSQKELVVTFHTGIAREEIMAAIGYISHFVARIEEVSQSPGVFKVQFVCVGVSRAIEEKCAEIALGAAEILEEFPQTKSVTPLFLYKKDHP